MISDSILTEIASALEARGMTLASAESCTGGMVGMLITSLPGSSRFYRGGVVAYSDDLKRELLGVDPESIRLHGAVSAQVAMQMASGVRHVTESDIGIAITGIAGPGGGSPAKPVGTVCLAVDGPGIGQLEMIHVPGDRETVRRNSALRLLEILLESLRSEG